MYKTYMVGTLHLLVCECRGNILLVRSMGLCFPGTVDLLLENFTYNGTVVCLALPMTLQ